MRKHGLSLFDNTGFDIAGTHAAAGGADGATIEGLRYKFKHRREYTPPADLGRAAEV